MDLTWVGTCVKCVSEKKLNETYDTYFCSTCDVWLEDKCGDPECEFCTARPDKPSDC